MSRHVVQDLVNQRRYAEAIHFADYSSMLRSFELAKSTIIVGGSVTEERANMRKKSLVRTTSQNIELLAGAGDTERARDLIQRVLDMDRSDETLATLKLTFGQGRADPTFGHAKVRKARTVCTRRRIHTLYPFFLLPRCAKSRLHSRS